MVSFPGYTYTPYQSAARLAFFPKSMSVSLVSTIHTYFSWNATFFITLGTTLAVAAFWFSIRKSDPYGLFHLELNKLPSDDPHSPPPTEWLNMGLWSGVQNFPEACKALALKNIAAARLKPGSQILDVGHGTGESLLLLLSDSSIPRPSLLVGITSLGAHYERSKRRVEELAYKFPGAAQTQVILFHDDAVWNDKGASKRHPLQPPGAESTSSDTFFDAVLVLDCAYHFDTRQRFLKQASQKLKPGGRISLADICFSDSALRTPLSKWLIRLLKLMPSSNVTSKEGYEAQMREVGYTDISMEDITEDVFPGFISFLKSKGAGWWLFGQLLSWYVYAGARFVIASGSKN
ncbi:S-adenosyl-L-methionine-dependent methyltransferase [Panaeolus papilionaceus]|nr:S-adenosyl-L-methionine-dependent methyltransferase [Panaeolus papilionaceus]